MKKSTDTELLETLLSILGYSIDYCGGNELAKKTRVEATNSVDDSGDKDIGCCRSEDCCPNEDACEDKDIGCTNRCGDCAEATYSSREYYELKKEIVEKDHEIWKLKRTIEALEYLIYNCIPKDDRRKD